MKNISQRFSNELKQLKKSKSIISIVVNVEPYSKSNFLKFSKGRTYQPEDMKEKDRIVAAECARFMGANNINKFNKAIVMQIDGYFKTRRVFDASNLSKSICDALNDVAYFDDRQIVECICTKTYDKENPRIEIYIEELNIDHPLVNISNLETKTSNEENVEKVLKVKKTSKKVRRIYGSKQCIKKSTSKQKA